MDAAEVCNAAAIRRAARRVSKLYDDALAPEGIGINQFSVLAQLYAGGAQRLAELADVLVMDRSTLGHLVRPLQRRGLVRLRVAHDDRRGRELVLTPAGDALFLRARPLWRSAQKRFERSFGADAARDLRATLRRLVRTAGR